jgi:hypothetical protein
MKLFFGTLPRNFLECFRGRMVIGHLTTILLTVGLVLSGFDWHYFTKTRSSRLLSWFWPAVVIGGLLPIVLSLALLAVGTVSRSARMRLVG